MEELAVIGKQKVGKYEFTGIEGGFGEDKKSMLVKDIAAIHGTDIRTINQTINRNRKRFKDGVDIIDLKQITESDLFSKLGFTKAQWGNAKNIYLLSERGYAKLLKILDDDRAWEIYDELVNNYFTLRHVVRTGKISGLSEKRVEVMATNAKVKLTQQLLQMAKLTASQHNRELIISEAAKVATDGRLTLTVKTEKLFTATDLEDVIGVKKNVIGRLAKLHGIQPKEGMENEFGEFQETKAKHTNRKVQIFAYNAKGVKELKKLAANWKKNRN